MSLPDMSTKIYLVIESFMNMGALKAVLCLGDVNEILFTLPIFTVQGGWNLV